MRVIVVSVTLALAFAGTALAQGQHWVNGYYRSNGTYVQGHMQTNPDGNPYNNWSTRGNVNPYTGQPGYQNPNPLGYAPVPVPQYQVPQYSPQQPTQVVPSYGGGINPYVNNSIPRRTCAYGSCF